MNNSEQMNNILSDESYKILTPLEAMKSITEDAGIDFLSHFGLRNFLYSGHSFGITTNNKWNEVVKQSSFRPELKQHYTKDLNIILKNGFVFLIRTEEQANTSFLKRLADAEMCNNLAIYTHNFSGVRGYFFTAPAQEKNATHYFANNLLHFQNIVTSVETYLNKMSFWSHILSIPENIELFSGIDKQLIFSGQELLNKRDMHRVYLDDYNKHFVFTHREMQILSLIRLGYTAKEIANCLGVIISVRTIEGHIYNIKKKTRISSKEDLKYFATKVCQFTPIKL